MNCNHTFKDTIETSYDKVPVYKNGEFSHYTTIEYNLSYPICTKCGELDDDGDYYDDEF